MSSSKEKINREYLANKVNPLLEKLVVDLLINKPDNSLAYMKQWLDDKGEKIYASDVQIDQNQSQQDMGGDKRKDAYGDESDEEHDEENDEIEEMNFVQKVDNAKSAKSSRTSVSAEVYGSFNKKASYQAKVISKSEEQIQRIKTRLSQAFMFSALDEKEQSIVIGAFEECKFAAGDYVIKQGEDGEVLFLVDSGQLDCYKTFKVEEGDKFLKSYLPGEAFGELALLYNAPRAATIKAQQESVCFSLDRECFNNIVKDAAMKKREAYDSFLSSIELLKDMENYERSKIADALKPLKFAPGEFVVKEGDKGDTFFFVEEGEAAATKQLNQSGEAQIVFEYKQGDYFGELALLKDTPRQANIVAKTDLKLVQLDRQSFKRLLGPLEEILQRNFQRYEKFLS